LEGIFDSKDNTATIKGTGDKGCTFEFYVTTRELEGCQSTDYTNFLTCESGLINMGRAKACTEEGISEIKRKFSAGMIYKRIYI
jgi:hypothetical protein